MAVNVKTLNEDEFFFGHKACAGCGGSLALRIALKVLGKNTVSVIPAGCMSAVGFNYPQLCFANNSILCWHSINDDRCTSWIKSSWKKRL